jgi:hypothetical protein
MLIMQVEKGFGYVIFEDEIHNEFGSHVTWCNYIITYVIT